LITYIKNQNPRLEGKNHTTSDHGHARERHVVPGLSNHITKTFRLSKMIHDIYLCTGGAIFGGSWVATTAATVCVQCVLGRKVSSANQETIGMKMAVPARLLEK
jgi:hypothetical protein